MKTIKHNTAGCFLTRKNGEKLELLLIHRKWPEGDEGWLPPKGHIETDESFKEAAVRETTEETGYKNLSIVRFLKTVKYQYDWPKGKTHDKTTHWFLAKLNDETMVEKVLDQWEKDTTVEQKWFDISEARKFMRFDNDREILDLI